MRQLLVPLESLTVAGAHYSVRAVGRERADGIWEGYIEFETPSRVRFSTGLETTQKNEVDLEAWARSLGRAYLNDALRRASSRRGGPASFRALTVRAP